MAQAMTDEERARAIYAGYCLVARARSKPHILWDQLPEEKRQRLISAAGRLRAEYATDIDPPSRGGFG
jgi:hypothetical protein